MNLVDAQQARRVLDRLVGYKISPLIWAKVKRGLSAGRVQSVALRMIGDREDEINSFIPEEYWSLDANLSVEGEKKLLSARYYGPMDQTGKAEKAELGSQAQVEEVMNSVKNGAWKISEVKKSERSRKSPLPFTTSTLQQEASRALNFSTSKTMRIAQQLYEGVDIKGQGTVALITYLRTDSTRISDEAQAASSDYILERYGQDYLNADEKKQESKGHVQDAHEAIRPTDVTRDPASIKESLTREQYRLYQLIWKRFLASRMSPARYESTQVRILAEEGGARQVFTVSAQRLVFDGFQCIYNDEENPEKANALVRGLEETTAIRFDSFDPRQHFTQPAPHFTEASLVRALEEQGIGRPSTYAPTISTILARNYIVKEEKNLYMTELGTAVNNIMKKSFPSIVNPEFTANMENLLDCVAEGTVRWKTIVENFYPDLDEAVREAEKELEKVKIADEETDVVCENCGRNMVIKYGPHGKFLACPGFPECHNTKPYYQKIGVMCPKCGKDIVVRMSKKGRRYYGCLGNPDCDFMSWQKPSSVSCPVCGSIMLEKGRKLVCFNDQCGHVMERPEQN